MHVLFPGSFDPITNGHLSVIRRAARFFDRVTVGVFQNEEKTYLFTPKERVLLVRRAVADIPGVDVALSFGYVADYCKQEGISLLVRGIRGEEDIPFERMAADFNRERGVDTLLFLTEEELAHTSSTDVRRLLLAGKSPKGLVPDEILDILLEKTAKMR